MTIASNFVSLSPVCPGLITYPAKIIVLASTERLFEPMAIGSPKHGGTSRRSAELPPLPVNADASISKAGSKRDSKASQYTQSTLDLSPTTRTRADPAMDLDNLSMQMLEVDLNENDVREFQEEFPDLATIVENYEPANRAQVEAILAEVALAIEGCPEELVEALLITVGTRKLLVAALLNFIADPEIPHQLRVDLLRIITDLVGSEGPSQTTVVEEGAIAKLVSVVESCDPSASTLDIEDLAIWALATMAGTSTSWRDEILATNAVQHVLRVCNNYCEQSHDPLVLSTIALFVHQACTGPEDPPDWLVVEQFMPVIGDFVFSADPETVEHVCWAMENLTSHTPAAIDAVVHAKNLVARLVELVVEDYPEVQLPALRTLGNITLGTEAQTQAVIDAQLLPELQVLLHHPDPAIRKDGCWAISNICAGTSNQIQAVIEAQLFPQVTGLLTYGDYPTKKAALWAVGNLCIEGRATKVQLERIVTLPMVRAVSRLSIGDNGDEFTMVMEALEVLQALLTTHRETKPMVERSGLDYLYACLAIDCTPVAEKAATIISTFFEKDLPLPPRQL